MRINVWLGLVLGGHSGLSDEVASSQSGENSLLQAAAAWVLSTRGTIWELGQEDFVS